MLSTRRSALQADVSFELVWTASRGSVQILSHMWKLAVTPRRALPSLIGGPF